MRVVGLGLFLAFVVAAPAHATSGFVVSADGKPVPAVTIEIARPQAAAERHAVAIGLRKPTPPIARTTSGTDGSFNVKVDAAGIVQVSVRAEGFAPAALLATSDDDLVVISLDPVALRKGRVTSGGAPVKEALVVADDEHGQTLAVRTAADGTFSIPDPERWASRLTVLHPDYAMHQVSAAELSSLDFVMTPGAPLPGASVERADGSAATDFAYLAMNFPIATIHGDTRTILAATSRDQELSLELPGEMVIVRDRAAKKPIRTAATRIIEGTIRDPRGRALAGVPVVAWSERTQGTLAEGGDRSAISDTNGHYRIEVAGNARYEVIPYVAEIFQFDHTPADLRRAKSATLNFSARPVRFTTGVVTGDEGKPVAGAMVTMLTDRSPVVYAHFSTRWPIAITDAAGRYRLRSSEPPNPEMAGLADSAAVLPQIRAVAIVPGYAATTSEKFALNKVPSRIDIRLSRGLELAGRVTLADGQPVENASIVAAEARAGDENGALSVALSYNTLRAWTTSDKDGQFAIRVQDQPHTLGIWKEGFAGTNVSNVRAGDRNIVVTLDRGHTISGKLIGGTASTRSGQVTASSQNRDAFARTTVDGAGRFTIPNLPAGAYVVRYQDEQSYAEVIAQAPSDDVTLELPERRNLTGKVVDESGSPVATFSVSQRSENFYIPEPEAKSVTAESGEFSIAATVGECTVTVSSPGFGTSEQRVIVSEHTPPLTFVLKRARMVTGRVTDPSGAGIANVTIEVEDSNRNHAGTDESGEFTIDDADTAEFTLKARSRDHLTASTTVPAGSTETRVDIVVASGETISGRVVDPKGSGLSRTQVSLSPIGHEADFRFATSDAEGKFTAKGLAKGRYAIEARLAGVTATVEVDTAEAKPLVIVLKPSATGSIAGTVKVPPSVGWAQAFVVAQGTDGQQFATADSDGRFLVENVPAGDVAVTASVNNGNSQRSSRAVHVTVQPDQKAEVELTMDGGSTVRGSVTRDGIPAVGASIAFQSLVSDSMAWRTTADLHGSYVVEGLPPGDYEVTASSLTLRASRQFTVSGDSTTFDVAIEDHGITGLVVDSKGVGISDATVEILGPAGHHDSVEAKTAANGEFLLRTSDSFPIRLAASKSGFGPAIRTLDAQPSSPLIITLNSTAGLRVRLVASDTGAALSGYTAVRDSDGVEIPAAREERDGVMLLSLPGGSYKISASAAGYASRTVRAQVPLDGDLRIALSHGGTLVVLSHETATDLVKLVAPDGEEYVQCYCNGIATIRLKGKTTTIEHVQAGSYMLQILNASGGVTAQQPITIAENGKTIVDLERH
jgi:protocatechuate 3,4-dioxygenase beta subunit